MGSFVYLLFFLFVCLFVCLLACLVKPLLLPVHTFGSHLRLHIPICALPGSALSVESQFASTRLPFILAVSGLGRSGVVLVPLALVVLAVLCLWSFIEW